MDNSTQQILFSDHFQIDKTIIAGYGSFNVSLLADLPLFIDPFLLFNSTKPEYQALHHRMINYLMFLRDKSVRQEVTEGLLDEWYRFKEVKQTWLGFSVGSNRGSGLGNDFAEALNENFNRFFF